MTEPKTSETLVFDGVGREALTVDRPLVPFLHAPLASEHPPEESR